MLTMKIDHFAGIFPAPEDILAPAFDALDAAPAPDTVPAPEDILAPAFDALDVTPEDVVRRPAPDVDPDAIAKPAPAPTDTLNEASGLPTYALPDVFNDVCRAVSKAYNVPLDVVTLSALTMAGATAGGLQVLEMGGYSNRPGLMTIVIAPTGAGKSEPLDFITRPGQEFDTAALADYKTAMTAWRAANGKSKTPEPKPAKTQFLCAASTDAARVEFVCDNPRGGLLYRDELTGLFEQLTAKFNDEAMTHFIEFADFRPCKIHTKTDDDVPRTPHSFLPILGGIQPRVLQRKVKPDMLDSGFMHRFTPVSYDAGRKIIISEAVDPAVAQKWAALLRTLRAIGEQARTYSPSTEAAQVYADEFRAWADAYVSTYGDDERQEFAFTAYKKTLYTIHRLTLIAHLLRAAAISPECNYVSNKVDADIIRWAFAAAPWLYTQRMALYNLIRGDADKPRKMTDADVIRAVVGIQRRNGVECNQSALAKLTGIARPNINSYLKGY